MTIAKFGRAALAGASLAVLLSGAARAEPERIGLETLLGGPLSSDAPVNRVVRIDASTRWVNVNEGDFVKFVARNSGAGGDYAFSWDFSTQMNAINLEEIAPAGMIGRRLYVYIAHPAHSD
jgi:hypothetical protein